MSRTSYHRRGTAAAWSLVAARTLTLTLLLCGIGNITPAASTIESPYPLLLAAATDSHRAGEPPAARVPGAACNLVVAASHRAFVSMIWDRSRTFRRQCVRLSAEPQLTVRVTTAVDWSDSGTRAATQLRRRTNGSIEVDLQLPARPSTDCTELIAHEIEHIIEQLDGVDLARSARRTPQLVWASTSGGFETLRAIETGRMVALEVQPGAR